MPIRVAFIDHTALLSGGEIALLNLVTHLDRARVEPVVVLFEDGPLAERLRSAGVETHVLPISSAVMQTRKDSLGTGSLLKLRAAWASLLHAWRLRGLLRGLKVRIVHTNSLKSDLIGGLAGRLAGKRVVWHVRDRIDADYLPSKVVRIFRVLARWLPHHVIAISSAVMETLHLPVARVGIRSHVIHDGTLLPAPAAAAPRGEPPTVVLIGRITRWKGQHVLLQAAAILRERGIAARYRLIGAAMFGEDAYGKELHDLADSLGLNDIVEFAGFRSDIDAQIASADLIVHTSTTPEPFGQVVVEGMAAGKPVIATRAGGVIEIIEHDVSGLLVPPGDAAALADALTLVLNDPQLAARLGAGGRARVEARFTIDRVARDIERLFESIVA